VYAPRPMSLLCSTARCTWIGLSTLLSGERIGVGGTLLSAGALAAPLLAITPYTAGTQHTLALLTRGAASGQENRQARTRVRLRRQRLLVSLYCKIGILNITPIKTLLAHSCAGQPVAPR
jgi:hypothetical protein